MKKPTKTEIKKAVLANRGGFREATMSQIMAVWNSLTSETQQEYIDSLKEEGKQDAVSNRPKSEV